MKKAVITILLLLPLMLIFIISAAGRLVTIYTSVYPQIIYFCDENGDAIEGQAETTVSLDETKQLKWVFFPSKTTETDVRFTSSNENVASVDGNGLVQPHGYGTAVITVTSITTNVTNKIIVNVADYEAKSLSLDTYKLSLETGQEHQIVAQVLPVTALDKTVSYASSAPSVATVSPTGKIKAVGEGIAEITVSTANGITASVTVSVEGNYPLRWKPYESGSWFVVGTGINLLDYVDTTLDVSTISFEIVSGSNYASIDGSTLCITSGGHPIRVKLSAPGFADLEAVFINK